MLNTGELQALSFVAKSPEREAYALFLPDNVLHVSRTAMFIRREQVEEIHYRPPLEAMMRRWRFGAAQGYYYSDEIVDLIKAGSPLDLSAINQIQLFKMLIASRFDIAFGASNALERAEEQIPGIDKRIQRIEGPLLAGKAMYLAFSNSSGKAEAIVFAHAYRDYRASPEYARLATRYGVSDLLPKTHEFK